MLKVDQDGQRLDIFLNNRLVLSHSAETPFIEAVVATPKNTAVNGKTRKTPLTNYSYDPERMLLRFSGGEYSMAIQIQEDENTLTLKFQRSSSKINRVFLSFPSNPESAVYGCGDHKDATDLRGKKTHVKVSLNETAVGIQGVNFIKSLLNFKKINSSAFTMPFYVNSEFSFVYINTDIYTILDFTMPAHQTAEIWGIPESIIIGCACDYAGFTGIVTKLFGKQTILPQWATDGVWLETHGGTGKILATLERAIKSGVKISALTIRDWSSGGDKPFWDWILNTEHYPRLDELMRELMQRELRVLAYVNPYLSIEGRLFAEASKGGYLVKNEKKANLLIDMGGLMAGLIDLTNIEACIWYKKIIKENILNIGFSGFVADLRGSLPDSAVFKSGETARTLHNKWPLIWARINREAIREAGRADAVAVLSAGYSGSSGETMLFSLPGQKPSWSPRDGLPNALTASLSAGICGMGVVSSKIGGDAGGTMHRCSKELYMRWTEMAAFMPVMEASADAACGWKFDSDEETNKHFTRMSKIHAALVPYIKQCLKANANNGVPVMRPLFMSFPGDENVRGIDDEYMLGDDLLIAPVMSKKRLEREVKLPKGNWIHLWSGREYTANTVLEAPFGAPPVFYKSKSKHHELFESIAKDLSL